MTSRMEDYSELLKTLDEILQEEHDVEISASAAAIRALLAENVGLNAMMDKMEAKVERLREVLEWQNRMLSKHITENDLPAHRLLLPDGSCHTGPVVDWVREVFAKWSEINTQALTQTSTREGEE